MKTFYSNGKLLLSGEYVILEGALGLAIPTSFGQYLQVEEKSESGIHWQSFDHVKKCWFETRILPDEITRSSYAITSDTRNSLLKILQVIIEEKPDIFKQGGYQIRTHLDFPRDWGLGSSSTLINNLAQWAGMDAFALQAKTFEGSGYDIACAQRNNPITYRYIPAKPEVTEVTFSPAFKDRLYFIYLNKKQNSRKGIDLFKSIKKRLHNEIHIISAITNDLIKCTHIEEFEMLIDEHENLIGGILNQQPIKGVYFSDYFGAVKSLGAWGGDFVLATGDETTPNYFRKKGFPTVIAYKDMVL